MAGTVAAKKIIHRSRQIVRTNIKVRPDTSGAASGVVTTGFGRLVGVLFKPGLGGYGPLISVSDAKTGAALFSYQAGDAAKFSNTTTGDTTGGASEDLWTTGAVHGLVDNDIIVFTAIAGNGAGGPSLNTPYYVDQKSTTTFQVLDGVVGVGNVINVGATDATSATWYKVGSVTAAAMIRPSTNIVDTAGATIAAADTAPNVWRDIVLGGQVRVVVAGGDPVYGCDLAFLVNEAKIGDVALTV